MILENIEFILSGSGKNLLVLSQKFRNTVLISLQSIGQFQKISIHHDGRLFGIPRARGGSLNWNSEGMGGYLHLEF